MLRRRFAGPPQRAVVQLQEAAGGRLAGNVACQGFAWAARSTWWDSQNEFTKHDDNQILGLEKGCGILKTQRLRLKFLETGKYGNPFNSTIIVLWVILQACTKFCIIHGDCVQGWCLDIQTWEGSWVYASRCVLSINNLIHCLHEATWESQNLERT